MPLKMRVHDRESIGMALRRFKKLLERSGITKELRKRKFYLKPCEQRRRTELRKQSAIRKGKAPAKNSSKAHFQPTADSVGRFSPLSGWRSAQNHPTGPSRAVVSGVAVSTFFGCFPMPSYKADRANTL